MDECCSTETTTRPCESLPFNESPSIGGTHAAWIGLILEADSRPEPQTRDVTVSSSANPGKAIPDTDGYPPACLSLRGFRFDWAPGKTCTRTTSANA